MVFFAAVELACYLESALRPSFASRRGGLPAFRGLRITWQRHPSTARQSDCQSERNRAAARSRTAARPSSHCGNSCLAIVSEQVADIFKQVIEVQPAGRMVQVLAGLSCIFTDVAGEAQFLLNQSNEIHVEGA